MDQDYCHKGKPHYSDWTIWRNYITRILLKRGRKLKTPLGWWFYTRKWPWYYSPKEDELFLFLNDTWTVFPRIPRRSGRPLFSKIGRPAPIPSAVHNATVSSKGNYWVCTGHCESIPTRSEQASDLWELLSSKESEKWCFENVQIEDNANTIATAIRNRVAIAVSDRSYKSSYGTEAWIIEGEDSSGRVVGCLISPGRGSDQSPYRSELAELMHSWNLCRNCVNFITLQMDP